MPHRFELDQRVRLAPHYPYLKPPAAGEFTIVRCVNDADRVSGLHLIRCDVESHSLVVAEENLDVVIDREWSARPHGEC